MKKILLLGATGSIGKNVVDVIKNFPEQYQISAIAASNNAYEISKIASEFSPSAVYIKNKEAVSKLEVGANVKVYSGEENLINFVEECEYDIMVNALVGSVGFLPTLRALEKGASVALANKESLVAGGEIIMPLAKEKKLNIIPIDSEHSAIFQILRHFEDVNIHKLILTASGGPFFNKQREEIALVKAKDALKHPTWDMGSKITIDSSTLMNKGLEVIEAHHLFGISYEDIEVVVHPQSIVHSLVEFVDGEIYAQLGLTDMRYPIQNALTYPKTLPTPYKRLNLTEMGTLSFFPPKTEDFPMLTLAYKYGKEGGLKPAVFNASNEECVLAFLEDKIRFYDIAEISSKITDAFKQENISVGAILNADNEARIKTRQIIDS